MKLSFILPTKNEPYVAELVRELRSLLRRSSYEIIIVDKSPLPPKVRGAKVVRQKSNGLGNAILEGVSHATGDVICFMDADGSHRPCDALKLVKAARTYDIVIGSRFVRGGRSKDNLFRKVVTHCFRVFAKLTLGLKLEDPMSGFAAVRRVVFQDLRLNPLGYKLLLEMVYKAREAGYRWKEVPIVFERRKGGRSKAGIREALRTIRLVFELRLHKR